MNTEIIIKCLLFIERNNFDSVDTFFHDLFNNAAF